MPNPIDRKAGSTPRERRQSQRLRIGAATGTIILAPGGGIVDTPDGLALNLATNETPGGLVNGTNDTYTLAFTPVAGTEEVFVNGLLMEGGGNDYTLTGTSIVFIPAAVLGTGEKIRVNYRKA